MSVSTIDLILIRIQSSGKSSPIAVFYPRIGKYKPNTEEEGKLDAVFYNTVKTRNRVKNNDPLFIGIFDHSMDQGHIKGLLERAVNK